MIGLAVTTCDRRAALQGCIAALRQYTTSEYRLLVADDGSEDGTQQWLAGEGIPFVTGRRLGIARNRNRGLYCLRECDVILTLEDDAWPNTPGWEIPWVEGAKRWGHLQWAKFSYSAPLDGAGTVESPYRCHGYGAQVTATTKEALAAVGYMDSHFQGYGCGHIEWARRFAWQYRELWGFTRSGVLCLASGIEHQDQFPTFRNQEDLDRNFAILQELDMNPPSLYRDPWGSEEERAQFVAEVGE